MDPEELGVETPEDEVSAEDVKEDESAENEDDGGHHSDKNKGTDEDADITPEDGDEGTDPSDPNIRINNLMSKWQKEENSHHKTKSELDLYKERFGNLEGGNKQQIDNTDDDDLPESFREDWEPRSKEDIQQAIREASEYGAKKALKTIEERQLSRQKAEESVNDFISEVKDADKEFDEKAFYKYASDHNFPVKSINDLRSVYSSYVTLRRATGDAVKNAFKNKDKRNNPINKPGGGQKEGSLGIDASKIRNSHSATDLIEEMYNS